MKKYFKLRIIKAKMYKGEKKMGYKFLQDKFDVVKWYDSILAGEDRCGTYDFCVKCKKEKKYPCARAQRRFENGLVRLGVVSYRKGE